jgi:chaperonin GroEL
MAEQKQQVVIFGQINKIKNKMSKVVLFGKENRDSLLKGVQKITDAIRCTMGAAGKNVLIGEMVYHEGWQVNLPTRVSKDGYTVSKYFELQDPVENRGAMLIKEAASKTVEEAGDSTTCTCVLAESLISNGMKLIDEGANSQELKKGMDAALDYVVSELTKMSTPVKGDTEKIRQIATVSANNDKVIGDLIAEAFSQIGDEGVIDVEESKGLKTEIKITDGYKFDRGWVSQMFVTNRAKDICEFENPLILLYQNRINHHTQLEAAIQISMSQQRPLLIIAEDCVDEGLAYLAINNARKQINVCAIKSPFGTDRNEGMEDIALITGGTYISDIRGIDIKQVEFEHLGSAQKVIISKGETVIIRGSKDEAKFNDFVNDLRMNLAQAKTEEEKSPIEKRIARLTGKGAILKVGAATETELNEKLDRVDDAVRATKAAIAEGFVPGGGIAFLKIPLPIVKEDNDGDIMKGWNLIFSSIEAPFVQICENAGVHNNVYFKMVEDLKKEVGNIGYNVLSGKKEDMILSGVIDSTKALSSALRNAVSVAGMVLTSEASIITIN